MSPIRFRFTMLGTLLTTVTLVAFAPAQGPRINRSTSPGTPAKPAQVDDQGLSCVVYGLGDFGDEDFGAWIARTMTGVIQPSSWNEVGGSGVVSYYGPARMLVVYQTPAVHAQIDVFLKNVKKSLPPAKAPMTAQAVQYPTSVIQAQHVAASEPGRAAAPAPAPTTATTPAAKPYPIPAPLQHPKHLFHFIIRYEGDGVIDANLASLAKSLVGDTCAAEEKSDSGKADSAKSLSQLFNVILRYEGDGIIDENVAEVIKFFHAMQNGPHADTIRTLPTTPAMPPTEAPLPANVNILPAATSSLPTTSLPTTSGQPSQLSGQFVPHGPVYITPGLPQTLPHALPRQLPSVEPRPVMPPADSPAPISSR